eukprot:scaffold5835_cov138-Isochrysis_galbana.AAC.2
MTKRRKRLEAEALGLLAASAQKCESERRRAVRDATALVPWRSEYVWVQGRKRPGVWASRCVRHPLLQARRMCGGPNPFGIPRRHGRPCFKSGLANADISSLYTITDWDSPDDRGRVTQNNNEIVEEFAHYYAHLARPKPSHNPETLLDALSKKGL